MERGCAHAPVAVNETSTPKPPTRYVEHPARRRAWRAAQRNLAWGIAFLFAALSVVSIAVFIGGPRAILPLLICVLSFTALWVLARMKIFAQRNGVFFSLAVLAMLGAFAALIEQAWIRLSGRPAGEPRVATAAPIVPAAATAQQAPQIPSLIEALRLDPPDATLPRARAARDLTTTIGGKTYAIRRGDVFLFADEKGGEVTLSAGEFLARVPANAMEMLAPAPIAASAKAGDDGRSALDIKANTEITQRAQAEAMRRYPALARKGTPENTEFVETSKQLFARKSDFLDNPEWPLELAQMLAHRNGWKESGVIEDDAPAVVETPIAPGTKVLAEPSEPDIPPPPREPGR